eukprot:5492346-Pyramimonas_sp.AAC.1
MLTDLVGKYSVAMTQTNSLMAKIQQQDSPMKKWADTPKFQGRLQGALNYVQQLLDENEGLKLALTLGDMTQVNPDDRHTMSEMEKLQEALGKLDEIRAKINSIAEDSDSD